MGRMYRLPGGQVTRWPLATWQPGYPATSLLPGRALRATCEHLPDAREQNFFPDRLPQEVGRSCFEALRFDLGARGSGDEDRRRLDPLLDHDLEEAEAVQRRDVDVEDQEVELPPGDLH